MLSRRGAKVTIFDQGEPGRGASVAAAGMLAAGYEAAIEASAHPQLMQLCRDSADMWSEFARSLEDSSGYEVHYRTGETIAVQAGE